jgi:Tfp pilus assembly protein PilO
MQKLLKKNTKAKVKVDVNVNDIIKDIVNDKSKRNELLKKYFNQKTFYGICVVGILLLIILYAFVFLGYSQKTETLSASNQALKLQVQQLQEYSDNMALYQSQINDMKTEINDILDDYPAGAKEEDVIMLAVEMQKSNQIGYSTINMGEVEELYSIPYEEVMGVGIEGLDSDLTFAGKYASYSITTTYSDLKAVIANIFNSDNRIGINNIVLVKDEEDGTLSGSIDLYFYSAAGNGKEYIAPDISEYLAGTSDIFKSLKTTASSQTSEETDGEDAEVEANEGEENIQGQ